MDYLSKAPQENFLKQHALRCIDDGVRADRVDMFILPFEVLFDEEADQVDGLLMFVYGALVSSLITTCSCARRSIWRCV